MERRKHPRFPCRISCEIRLGKKKISGQIDDVSEGGLRVRGALEVEEETPLTVAFSAGPSSVSIDCMVWNQRRMRRASTGERFTQMGLVLVQPSDPFLAFVESLKRRGSEGAGTGAPVSESPAASSKTPESAGSPPARPPASHAPPPVERAAAAPPPAEPAAQSFRVRVKQDGGPRTRRLVVGAGNTREARERALEEIGAGWTVLDVVPA